MVNLWHLYLDWLESFTGGDFVWNNVISTTLVELLTFVLPSFLFTYVGPLSPLQRINEKQNPKPELLDKAYKEALIGCFIVHPIMLIFLSKLLRGIVIYDRDLPSFFYYLGFHFFSYFTNEFFFYWAHRAFHEFPSLYKLHKKHHEFNFTVGIAAEYAHPIEGVVCNILPTYSGAIIHMLYFGHVHACHVLVFVAFRLLQTTEAHSGFYFPISVDHLFLSAWLFPDLGASIGSNHHYFHHSHNKGNYSSPMVDRIFGTDLAYQKYIATVKSKAA